MSKTSLTYRDYEALPDDGRRYEIHDGELSATPAPTPQHQIVSGRLFLVLNRWLEAHRGGQLLYAPLDVILTDTSIVQPDIGHRYAIVVAATGPEARDLPPFTGLGLVPDGLWP